MTYGNPAARPLPDFPWDQLAPYAQRARQHPDGIVDLSIGTPVDRTPAIIQAALRAAADAPGYPLTVGSIEFRTAALEWLQRTMGVTGLDIDNVIPSIGSKEVVAWLPTFLRLDARDVVAIPAVAYPTYDVGARIAGCAVMLADGVEQLEHARVRAEASGRRLAMVWLNSPSNPTGAVTAADDLRAIVEWSREHNILVVSDECYFELAWDAQPVSILHPSIAGATPTGVVAVHSLSKRSNLAGYRAGVIAGDKNVIGQLLEIRKHAGMIMAAPVQAAAIAAFGDDEHVADQRERYRKRRDLIRTAVQAHGFRIDHSEAGLYLWATRSENCWDTVSWLADRGILVAPGAFYGAAGEQHVRIALTGTDDRISALVQRLEASA